MYCDSRFCFCWDIRERPETIRSIGVTGSGFQCISKQRGGNHILMSCLDKFSSINSNSQAELPDFKTRNSAILNDIRYCKQEISKISFDQRICKVHVDNTKIFLSVDRRQSLCGSTTYSVWTNDLKRNTAVLCTGTSFQKKSGNESTISPFAVSVCDSIVIGANCSGSVIQCWDFESIEPPVQPFSFHQWFRPL